ncbi:MAG: hypothetical protein FJX54_22330 [Alphaproteobacteria bacterium]|nr:hypothetical protein [Alphaproteobacteria bacterium]
MLAQYDLSSIEDGVDRSARPRLALAGGSDQPPPGQDEISAEVIRFPLERARPPEDEPRETAFASDDQSGTGALWAAWLTSVLSSSPAGIGREA